MLHLDAPVENVTTKRQRVPGAALKAARINKGLSQDALSKILDVRLATISERENAADVSLETWIAWAAALGMKWKPAPTVDVAQTKKPKSKPDA